MTDHVDIAEICRAIRDRVQLDKVAAPYVTGLKRRGREWVGLCPFHNEATPSFTIVPAKRFFHCFGCGAHGDVIGFLMRAQRLPFKDAVEQLQRDAGLEDPVVIARAKKRAVENERARAAEETRSRARRMSEAERRWARTRPAGGTIVETYLTNRGLDLAPIGGVPVELRFDPCAPHTWQRDRREWICGPAMVAAVRSSRGELVAVHCTYLRPDGRGKSEGLDPARKVWGPDKGGAIRLQPATDRVAVAEGIETALSVACALAQRGDAEGPVPGAWPVWAAISIGNIAGEGTLDGERQRRRRSDAYRHEDKRGTWHLPTRVPDPQRPGLVLPSGIRQMLLLEDNDNKDPPAAAALYDRAFRRFGAAGLRVWRARPPAGMDFNDWLMRRGLVA